MIEVTGSGDKIDAFEKQMEAFGVREPGPHRPHCHDAGPAHCVGATAVVIPEIITLAQAEAVFLALLIAGLVAGPLAFLVARRRSADALPTALAVGGPPVLLWVMWRVYNAVTDRLGLDTVANLLVNAAFFVVVGELCGVGWALLTARR